jgi:hypothetical protein
MQKIIVLTAVSLMAVLTVTGPVQAKTGYSQEESYSRYENTKITQDVVAYGKGKGKKADDSGAG